MFFCLRALPAFVMATFAARRNVGMIGTTVEHLTPSEGFNWANAYVQKLEQEYKEAQEDQREDKNHIYNALYFAKEVLRMAQDTSNYKQLTPEELLREKSDFVLMMPNGLHSYYQGNGRGIEVLWLSDELFEEAAQTGLDLGNRIVKQGLISLAQSMSVIGHVALAQYRGGKDLGLPWAESQLAKLNDQARMDKENDGFNANKIHTAIYMVQQLVEAASDTANYKHLKIRELVDAKVLYKAYMNLYILKSDFGDEIERSAYKLFDQAAHVGLDVSAKKIQSILYNCAVYLKSASYTTQLGLSQNDYGAMNSDKMVNVKRE